MSETQVMLRSSEGVVYRLDAKVAETPRQRAAGFQYICSEVAQQWAILFVFQTTQRSKFHMRNVKQDLEIAFISDEGRFLEIKQMTLEQQLEPYRNYQAGQAYKYALETVAGRLSGLSLNAEDWWLVLESWRS
jgi:uncharacterized membrane protein (UPF0127 family)